MGTFNNTFNRSFNQIGSNVHLFKDISLFVKSRVGSLLVDTITPENSASLLLPTTINNGVYISTGIAPVVDMIWVTTMRLISGSGHGVDGATNRFYYNNVGGFWRFGFGNKLNQSTIPVDALWHTFIVYQGKLWIVDPLDYPTDTVILNIINTVEPTISVTSDYTLTSVGAIRISGNFAIASYHELAFSYIGTITGGVITWSNKYEFEGNTNYVQDSVLGMSINYSAGNTATRGFSVYGSKYFMDYGFSRLTKAGAIDIMVPYNTNGIANATPTLPLGYTKYKDYSGVLTGLNMALCKVRFVNAFFDRSNAIIWKEAARGTWYDVSNPKDFHITELNFKTLISYLNTGYAGMLYLKVRLNSIIEADREVLTEVLLYPVDKTGNDEISILKYTGDISQAVVDGDGQYVFDEVTNYLIIA